MSNDNFDAEKAKQIIFDDNVNVTEPSPLKDLVSIGINIVLILACVYFSIYFATGAILNNLSIRKQIAIEKFMSSAIKTETIEITEYEQNRLNNIKNNILKTDMHFPKTSNLDIFIEKDEQLNALCYPNGNIYITSALYKELKSDEQLTFVIAHEMAHYKNRDHLLNLRRGISNSVVLIMLAIANPGSETNKIAESSLNITDLKYSREVEERADKYAVEVMNKLYGNANAGVEVMNILKDKNSFDIEFLSSHPNIDNRIEYIKQSSK